MDGGGDKASGKKKKKKIVLGGGVIAEDSKDGHGPAATPGKMVRLGHILKNNLYIYFGRGLMSS